MAGPAQRDLALGEPWRNERLFAKHFLVDVLPKQRVWSAETGRAHDLFAELRKLRASNPSLDGLGEEALETDYIRPIFESILGFACHARPDVFSHKSVKFPDYALFESDGRKQQAISVKARPEEFWPLALAVEESKAWHVDLDRGGREPGLFASESGNPAVQLDSYLRASGLRWGILTNGRLWRLYNSQSSFRLDTFYEVDLESVIERKDLDEFRRFYLFFRKEALLPYEGEPSFLDWCLGRSQVIGTRIADNLREQAYDALRFLMEGFFRHGRNGLDIGNEDHLKEVHDNAVILLYRLLFVLYGEARGFLPRANANYRKHSMDGALEEIRYGRSSLIDTDRGLHERFMVLFSLLDPKGEREAEEARHLGINPYNGGLFSDKNHPFLAQKYVGTKSLAEALRRLAFSEVDKEEVRVDYYELGTRQLGSIYEGLLEYKPRVAQGPLKKEAKGGVIRFVPATGVKADYKEGDIYFATEKDERKKSGSYYTPDPIVQYIVNKTLRPFCDEIGGRLEEEIALLEAKKNASRGANRSAYEKELDALKGQYDDRVLKLRVLDPAMGSGHFLVAACEFLAQRIVASPYSQDPEAPEGEAAIQFWKRKVATRCLYGVDLNPLAVELAKLSLWLSTLAKDRPLSFLDAKLKTGNSLIGASEADFAANGGSLFRTMLDHDRAVFVSRVQALAVMPETTIGEVKTKERLYAEFCGLLDRFRDASNLQVYNALTGEGASETGRLLEHLSDQPDVYQSNREEWQPLLDKASGLLPFHWELEYPEVLLCEGPRGFDAVIGNPPYVRQESLGDAFKQYARARYQTFAKGGDLYVCFYEKGHELLKEGGRFGMITSNKFMRAGYGKALRRFLSEKAKVTEIDDFGELPIFGKEAATFPAIVLTENGPGAQTAFPYSPVKTLPPMDKLDLAALESAIASPRRELSATSLQGETWTLVDEQGQRLLEKIKAAGVPLGQYVDGGIYYGIKTGLNKAFVIDRATRDRLIAEDPRSEDILKPFAVGDDIRAWRVNFQERFLIFAKHGIDIKKYPAILKHLTVYKTALMPRPADYEGKDWPGRKPGKYEWYELQDTIDYFREFEKPKILYPVIAKESRFALDETGSLSNDKTFMLPTGDAYLLAILNSALAWFFLRNSCSCLGDPEKGGRLELREIYMRHLPIRRINETVGADRKTRDQLIALAKKQITLHDRLASATPREACDINDEIASAQTALDRLVYDLYGLTEDEIAIAED